MKKKAVKRTKKPTKPKSKKLKTGWRKHPELRPCKLCGVPHPAKAHSEHGQGKFRKTHPNYPYKTARQNKGPKNKEIFRRIENRMPIIKRKKKNPK